MTEATLTIENKTGIHARPASVFVQTAAKFKSKVQGLAKGTEITIEADGPDEADAVAALKELIVTKFGEE